MLYYNIVRGANEVDLEARVNSLTGFEDSKWVPIGGPIIDKYGAWFQSLVAPKDIKVKIDNGPLTAPARHSANELTLDALQKCIDESGRCRFCGK